MILLRFIEFKKFILINVIAILMMFGKLASLGLLKITIFRNKGFDVIIFVHNFINKILSGDYNYIVNVIVFFLTVFSSTSTQDSQDNRGRWILPL